ncbi:MAG: hypothetical protein NC228_03670, partial [[Eubacterium] siraeum]|nr:hypothetical protein [[Eubacterium] siraeum]
VYGTLLYYYPLTVHNSYLYYYRYEHRPDYDAPENSYRLTELYRIDLKDKSNHKLFSFQPDEKLPEYPVIFEDALYFYEISDEDYESGSYRSTIYRYDTASDKTEIFKEASECPLVYKNGVIYYHEGGFYYCGDENLDAADGKYYGSGPLIFYANPEGEPELSGVFSDGETIMYSYYVTDEHDYYYAIGSTIGFIDENRRRNDIATTVSDAFYITNPRSFDGFYGFRQAPHLIIYDSRSKAFSKLLTEEQDFFLRISDDGALCIGLNCDPNDPTEKTFTKAVVYRLKRK